MKLNFDLYTLTYIFDFVLVTLMPFVKFKWNLNIKFGGKFFEYDGHLFVKDREGNEGKIYWKCNDLKYHHCRQRIHTLNEEVIESIGIHSDLAEPDEIENRNYFVD